MKTLKLFFFALTMFEVGTAARILCVLPIGLKSHSILFDRLLKELAEKGHDITYVTSIQSSKPTRNIKEIIIPDSRKEIMGDSSNIMAIAYIPAWLLVVTTPFMSMMTSRLILESEPVQKLLKSEEKFDLIFGEPNTNEAVIAGLSHKYGAPLVLLSTLMPSVWSNFVVVNSAPASYIPDPFYAAIPPMNFFQRTYNALFSTLSEVSHRVGLYLNDRVMRKHFGDELPCISDILTNTSLLLVNHHPALTFARPHTPNSIDVAGMHIYPPKPLPEDLEKYMTSAKQGVVLFSLGTNVKTSDLPKELIQEILKGLGRLKENVLWKFEKELDDVPSNVKMAAWLPQSDLLAHPNLKLFITHGGFLSITEAAFRGVPVVGIPLMVDQPINMLYAQNAGLGITLKFSELSGETLFHAANEVLSNPRYQEAAKEKSRLLQDTPMTPLNSAVWWIEFVLRNKGATHLRSPGRNLWWFQRHLLDVFAFLLCLALIYLWLLRWLFRKVCATCCKKNGHLSESDEKKDS